MDSLHRLYHLAAGDIPFKVGMLRPYITGRKHTVVAAHILCITKNDQEFIFKLVSQRELKAVVDGILPSFF